LDHIAHNQVTVPNGLFLCAIVPIKDLEVEEFLEDCVSNSEQHCNTTVSEAAVITLLKSTTCSQTRCLRKIKSTDWISVNFTAWVSENK